jgi:hypothetical protein
MKSFNAVCFTACAGWLCFSAPASAAPSDGSNPIRDILFAQAFRLDKPYTHAWRKEQPQVSAGYVLVLAVDPEFVRPQQVAEPVLYVGDQTAERINAGEVSGRLVVLVPSSANSRGEVVLDLNKALIWFGSPELPERVDAVQVNAETSAAIQRGMKPPSEDKIRSALRRGGSLLRLANREALERRLATLLQEYSPNETDLIRGLSLSGK